MPFVLKVQRQIYGGAAHTKSLQSAELEGGGLFILVNILNILNRSRKKFYAKRIFA